MAVFQNLVSGSIFGNVQMCLTEYDAQRCCLVRQLTIFETAVVFIPVHMTFFLWHCHTSVAVHIVHVHSSLLCLVCLCVFMLTEVLTIMIFLCLDKPVKKGKKDKKGKKSVSLHS